MKEIGNTVIVVEHDLDTIESADQIIDMGPKAGFHGGEVVFSGKLKEITKHKKSLTGKYLSGEKFISLPHYRTPTFDHFSIIGASGNNLKNVDVSFPYERLIAVTGVSGSGKSSLINQTLFPALSNMVIFGLLRCILSSCCCGKADLMLLFFLFLHGLSSFLCFTFLKFVLYLGKPEDFALLKTLLEQIR